MRSAIVWVAMEMARSLGHKDQPAHKEAADDHTRKGTCGSLFQGREALEETICIAIINH